MAHGFLVARRNVPAMPLPLRAITTRECRMPKRIPLSEVADDQGPRPKRRVRSSATAVCSAASAGASASVAMEKERFILSAICKLQILQAHRFHRKGRSVIDSFYRYRLSVNGNHTSD
jgi:hypothetical protein